MQKKRLQLVLDFDAVDGKHSDQLERRLHEFLGRVRKSRKSVPIEIERIHPEEPSGAKSSVVVEAIVFSIVIQSAAKAMEALAVLLRELRLAFPDAFVESESQKGETVRSASQKPISQCNDQILEEAIAFARDTDLASTVPSNLEYRIVIRSATKDA